MPAMTFGVAASIASGVLWCCGEIFDGCVGSDDSGLGKEKEWGCFLCCTCGCGEGKTRSCTGICYFGCYYGCNLKCVEACCGQFSRDGGRSQLSRSLSSPARQRYERQRYGSLSRADGLPSEPPPPELMLDDEPQFDPDYDVQKPIEDGIVYPFADQQGWEEDDDGVVTGEPVEARL